MVRASVRSRCLALERYSNQNEIICSHQRGAHQRYRSALVSNFAATTRKEPIKGISVLWFQVSLHTA